MTEKEAEPGTPAAEAVISYDPTIPFALSEADVATPAASVTAVFSAIAKVPDAPFCGVWNVTVTPAIGFPSPSTTVAWRFSGNVVCTRTDWGVPDVAVIEAVGASLSIKVCSSPSALL